MALLYLISGFYLSSLDLSFEGSSVNFCSEKDAQVSIYDISWEKDFGFCCQIDEECTRELASEYMHKHSFRCPFIFAV